ncbi:unnamed protein product, partial [Ectocarpus sp. 12 AP-2014]
PCIPAHAIVVDMERHRSVVVIHALLGPVSTKMDSTIHLTHSLAPQLVALRLRLPQFACRGQSCRHGTSTTFHHIVESRRVGCQIRYLRYGRDACAINVTLCSRHSLLPVSLLPSK